MIYSRKYGRSFRNRSTLMHYEWRDRQTRPIISWFGLCDASYLDAWRREHGLKTQQERREEWRKVATVLWIVAGAAWILAIVCSR